MCEHDLSDRETACADGMCPLCLAAENAALRHAIKMELEMYGADQPELTVDLPTAKGG